MDGVHSPHRLTHWVWGTLTIHLRHGAVVEHRVRLDEARRFHAIVSGTQDHDALTWATSAWIQFNVEDIACSTFRITDGGGKDLSAKERESLARSGHPRGAVRSLLDLWGDVGAVEPMYSAVAVEILTRSAVAGMPRARWDIAAFLLEGASRARRLEEIFETGITEEAMAYVFGVALASADGSDPDSGTSVSATGDSPPQM